MACYTNIVVENLAIHIDISDSMSWNGNTGLTVNSLTQWADAKISGMTLLDYGLTQYDIGLTNSLTASTTTSPLSKKYSMVRVSYNDESGNTYTTNYDILTGNTSGTSIGNYFVLSGGYLHNYFKLEDYNYELFPNRYSNGITIETWLEINNTNFSNFNDLDGIFLYLGARAENKYSVIFSGDSGYTTSLNNTLGSDNLTSHTQTITTSGCNGTTTVVTGETINYEQGLENNVIAFKFTSDKKIGYRKLNGDNIIEENYSPTAIDKTGWTMISISFVPYTRISGKIDCAARRLGDLIFYVNGRQHYKIKDFEEFYFKGLDTDKEKQIGVPYTLSWGGGSFGLEHSYHFNPFWEMEATNLIVDGDNGTFETNITGLTSNYILSADTSLYYTGNTASTTSLSITSTATSFNDTVLVSFNTPITLEANKQYLFKTYLYNLSGNSTNNIILELSGLTTGYTLLEQSGYTNYNTNDEWIEVYTKIETDCDFTANTNLYLYVNEINPSFSVYIDDVTCNKFNYIEDVYAQDSRKRNLLIEEYFNGSFYGKIQKLRLYTKALTVSEIQQNFTIESAKYGLRENFGGRLIYV